MGEDERSTKLEGLSPALVSQIQDLLRRREKLKATMEYRAATSCPLPEARSVIDQEELLLGIEPATIDEAARAERMAAHEDKFPDLVLRREEPPYLVEEFSVAHLWNSTTFSDCKERHFAKCILKHTGQIEKNARVVSVEVLPTDEEWYRSLTEEQQQGLVISLITQLGLDSSLVYVCTPDGVWEFPPE